MKVSYITYQIPFSETDAMGIVHHSNHARYLERARIEHMRLLGADYRKVMELEMHFPLTEMQIQFKRPLKFDQTIKVETKIIGLTRTRLNFGYRILLGTKWEEPYLSSSPTIDDVCVFGQTYHCCVNNAGRPVPINEEVFNILRKNFEENSIDNN